MSDNPFAELQAAAERQDQLEQAARKMRDARCHLVLGKPAPRAQHQSRPEPHTQVACAFFASLALPMRLEPCPGMGTASTDGQTLRYDPEFVASLSPAALIGLWAHEMLHVCNGHHWRLGQRDLSQWNEACDLAVNPLLYESGFTLPPTALYPGQGKYAHLPEGLSAEEYYQRLSDKGQPQDGGDDGEGDGSDPGQCGGVSAPGDGSASAQAQAQAETCIAAQQAAKVAKDMASRIGQGSLPAWLGRTLDDLLTPKVDWRDALHEFLTQRAKSGLDWSRPNRRYLPFDLYMPTRRSTTLGNIVCAVDTSGSIGAEMLASFGSEIQAILELFECSLTVLYHDTEVAGVQTWSPGDGPLRLNPQGGGGTSHRDVFRWVAEHTELEPTCLVALTDLYTDFPADIPEIPTLWAVAGNPNPAAPFGRVINIEE